VSDDHYCNLLKRDSKNKFIWSKKIKVYEDLAYVNFVRSKNNYTYVLSSINEIQANYLTISKLDEKGVLVWSKNVKSNGVEFNSFRFEISQDDNIYITSNSCAYQSMLIKLNSLGELLWTKTYYFSNTSTAINHIEMTEDDGVIFNSNSSDKKISLTRINADGTVLWNKSYQFNSSDIVYSSASRSKKDVIGNIYFSFNYISNGIEKVLIIKSKNNGEFQWSKIYEYGEHSRCSKMENMDIDSLGNLYLAGLVWTTDDQSSERCLILKVNTLDGAVKDSWYQVDREESTRVEVLDLKCVNENKIVLSGLQWMGSSFVASMDSLSNGICGLENINISSTDYLLNYLNTSVYNYDQNFTSEDTVVTVEDLVLYSADFCNELNVQEIEKNNEYSFYPNPFIDQLTLKFTDYQISKKIKLCDVLGVEYLDIDFEGTELVINRENLKSGTYFLKMIDATGKSVIEKVLID
jgi:hypothetical protein